MTQRVRDGLGLPAGFYRLIGGGLNPTFYAPNGITADRVASLIIANVVPVSDGYNSILYDSNSGVFTPSEGSVESPVILNEEATAFADDVLRAIYFQAHPGETLLYYLETSQSRLNIVGDLATLEADFTLDPG